MISDNYDDSKSQSKWNRLPSLTALRCFEAAAQAESFSKAADALHLTHGAISRAVRTLEEDLGLALFERRNRRVYLTDAGRQLYRTVHDGFGQIQETARALRQQSRQTAPLVLSCEPTLLMRWLIPRWPSFQAQHPETAVHLVAGGGPFSFAAGIDLAIRRNDFEWPSSVHAVPLFKERIGPVCSPDRQATFFEPGTRGMTLREGAARLHTKTRPQAWSTWETLRGSAPDDHAPRNQVFEHFYFSLQAAVAGLGVAIGPWHLVCDDIANGVLAAPLGFMEDGSSYCLLSPRKLSTAPQLHLLDWLRSVVER